MKNRWVIVFLIYADFRKKAQNSSDNILSMTREMKATLNQMFKDMITVPIDHRKARIHVIFNSIDFKKGKNTRAKTLLYKIGNPYDLDFNEIIDCDVISSRDGSLQNPNPGTPLQNPKLLTAILRKISLESDEEVFFVTWDHGSGFGIFREEELRIAEIPKPIYDDIERYPYLAMFWNAALKKDSTLKQLMNKVEKQVLPDTVQIGHNLYRVEYTGNNLGFDISRLKMQKHLNIVLSDALTPRQNFLIVFNDNTSQFEVSDYNLENNWMASKIEIAKLTSTGVREILSNDELANSFNSWLGKRNKIGVLLMMNCWMMNMHSMYSFANTVHYLVAPQSDIGVPGYNYKAILHYIFKDTHKVSAKNLAVKCVKTIETKRMRRRSMALRTDRIDIIDTWKVFALDLQVRDIDGKRLLLNQVSALRRLIKLINSTFDPDSDQEARWMYKYIRSVSYDFSAGDIMMIDILNWCLSLMFADGFFSVEGKSKLDPNGVKDELIRFRKQILRNKPLPSLLLAKTAGQLVYLLDDDPFLPTTVISIEPKGYSFFFPLFEIQSNILHSGLLQNVRKDKLLTSLPGWKKFLKFHIDSEIDY
jgi:hypothetical protein